MSFIENVSMDAIKHGIHYDPGPNSMVIQIVDPDHEFPKPMYPFKYVMGFRFWDNEKDEYNSISDDQADAIADLLRLAKEENINVIVHCHAGLCRSGAVAECGVFIGFQDVGSKRIPNLLVKGKIMESLGYSYENS